jgi:hypothetical protein
MWISSWSFPMEYNLLVVRFTLTVVMEHCLILVSFKILGCLEHLLGNVPQEKDCHLGS